MGKDNISVYTDLIRQLAELLKETGLTELEVEQDDSRIRLVLAHGKSPVAHEQVVVYSGQTDELPRSTASESSESSVKKDADRLEGSILSPMVGTVYTRPSPESEPYVRVGDTVTQGQAVMVIEAMKTFNEVFATKAGTVREVLVTDKQPVEYGQPLLVIS